MSTKVIEVLDTRGVNSEGLKMAMQRVWKTSREVKIESLRDSVFMFKFGLEADKRSIMAGGLCQFDRALMVLTEPVEIGDVKKQDFRLLNDDDVKKQDSKMMMRRQSIIIICNLLKLLNFTRN